MNIRVAIADRDEVYLERLGEGLQKNSDIICTRYSEPGAFFHALKNRKFDVVLFDTSILEGVEWSSLDFSGVTVPAVLYHEETETKDLPTGIEKVMKYQRVSGIYRSIVDLFASKGRKGLESPSLGFSTIIFRSNLMPVVSVTSIFAGFFISKKT